jgi:hypothetical protein
MRERDRAFGRALDIWALSPFAQRRLVGPVA